MPCRVTYHLLEVAGKARGVALHMDAVAQRQRDRQPGYRHPWRADRRQQRKGQG